MMPIPAVTQNIQSQYSAYVAPLRNAESKNGLGPAVTTNNAATLNTVQKAAVDRVTISKQAIQMAGQSKNA